MPAAYFGLMPLLMHEYVMLSPPPRRLLPRHADADALMSLRARRAVFCYARLRAMR